MASGRPHWQPSPPVPARRGLPIRHSATARLAASTLLLLWLSSAFSAVCSTRASDAEPGSTDGHDQADSAFTAHDPERSRVAANRSRGQEFKQAAVTSSHRLLLAADVQTEPQQAAQQALNRCLQTKCTCRRTLRPSHARRATTGH